MCPTLTSSNKKQRPIPKAERKSTVRQVEHLTDRARRTRLKLIDATRQLLNEVGYRQLRVHDVTAKAGVASGLFYRYFHDLREIVYEVSRSFMDQLLVATRNLPDAPHPYDHIFERHLLAARMFAKNPGVLRCLFQLDGDYDEFSNVWKAAAHDWNIQVAEFLQVTAAMPAKPAKRVAFVLGAMTEGVFLQHFIRYTKDLTLMGRRPEVIAEVIAVMWYRAIFLQDPPTKKIRFGNTFTRR